METPPHPDPSTGLPATALLKFQIGPVQDFIARARSARDLWSGSYLLSWLVAAGIRELRSGTGASLIFPSGQGQPLLKLDVVKKETDHGRLLTPNLPNLFVARVPADRASGIAKDVFGKISGEWSDIAKAVWGKREVFGLEGAQKSRFCAQVGRHLSISWQITRETGDYREDYRLYGIRNHAHEPFCIPT
jgi:CRISPR-associated protein Cmr2